MTKIRTNILLFEAIDPLVFQGKLQPSAVNDVYDLLEARCKVDAEKNAVYLDGFTGTLAEGVAAFVTERPFLAPLKNAGPSTEEKLTALQAEALAGSVTAHGQLHTAMGATAYAEWQAKSGAKPGVRAAVNPNAAALDEIQQKLDALRAGGGAKINGVPAGADNPFSKAGWNVSKQGALVKALGIEKASQIAAAAGARIGQTSATR